MNNQIKMYFHCGKCIDERQEDISPKDWQRIQVGWTQKGLQVWCVRHDMNVVALDFMGQKIAYDMENLQ